MSNTFLVGWARAVLALSNLMFLVLDTTGIKRDSDIIRVLIVNLAGEELYHQVVRPLRQPNQPNTLYTGLVQADLDQATTLAEQWPAIQEALQGKYVLAYSSDFIQARLIDSAQAYHLGPIYLVGDCLHEFSSQYCHRTSITLAQACAHVGFPCHINSAQERAQAQIVLIQAIADGQPRPVRNPAFQPAQEDLDHPF